MKQETYKEPKKPLIIPKALSKQPTINRNLSLARTRMVLAIDPMENRSENLKTMVDTALLWDEGAKNIEPTLVLTPAELGWPLPIPNQLKEKYQERAKNLTVSVLQQAGLNSKRLKVLVSDSLSLTAAVRKLVHHARKHRAELIVVRTKRKESEGWIGLGSFAERLLAFSKIPTMIIGAKVRAPKRISKIIFPTDFSAERAKAFEQTLKWAKKFGAELVLLHRDMLPLPPVMSAAFGLPMDAQWIQKYWEDNRNSNLSKADQMIADARRAGVSCRLVMEDNVGTWGEKVLAVSEREKADCIVFSVRRGLWSQVFLGNDIRSLLIHSKCPFIVIHS